MKKTLLIILIIAGLIGLLEGTGEAATDSANINLLVTPVVVTSLTVSSTFYNFGSVSLRTSTGSVTALTLTNNGQITVTVEKEVIADDDWDITLSSTTKDGFILWAMVSDNQPSHQAFVTGVSSFSNADLNTLNKLTNTAGNQVSMDPGGTNNLWFRLDMPYASSTSDEKAIQIRLTATSN